MLASANEQERATAGSKLAEMAREKEKTIAEFVRETLSFTAWAIGPAEPKSSGMVIGKWETANLLADLELAVQMGVPEMLTAWERQFTDDILRKKPTYMTERQAKVVTRIHAKLA